MRLRWRSVLPALLLVTTGLGVPLGACSKPDHADADAQVVVARYRGGEVTRAEFDAQVERQGAAGRPVTEGEGDWRVTLLEGLAVTEITAEAAPQDPALDPAIARATDAILGLAMVKRLGWDEIPVSAQQARAYYDEHPEVFIEPEKLRLQHIFLKAEAATLPAAQRDLVRGRLEGIRRQILAGADFAVMAREHSESADGSGGGWMVLNRGARVIRSFSDAAWALEENEVSETIDTPRGFHLARLAARLASVERPFEDVRQSAAAAARKVERGKREEAFLAERGPRYGFERRYEALAERGTNDDTVLFRLAGAEFTVGDMLATVNDTYRAHYHAGYLKQLPLILDSQALERMLILEARVEGLEHDDTVRQAAARSSREVRASFEIERRLGERSQTVSDADLLEFYELNRNLYEVPRLRSLSVIRLARDQGQSWRGLLEEGAQLAEAIREGTEFSTLAHQRSEHASATAGGAMPSLSGAEIRLRVQGGALGAQMIDALALGEVSNAFVGEVYDPQEVRFQPTGVYIVRLDDEVMPRQASFDEVKDRVRSDYLSRHRRRLLAELHAEVLTEAEFEIVEANLVELEG